MTDPSGQPIGGVQIEGFVSQYFESLEEAFEGKISQNQTGKDIPIEAITDNNGEFSITDMSGSGLTLKQFRIKGWQLAGLKNYRSYVFNPSVPGHHLANPKQPVEIVLESENK